MTDETPEEDIPETTSADMNKRILQCVQIRDAIARVKERHVKELQELNVLYARIEGYIVAFMDANKVENLKTKAGTCYRSTRWSATVQDKEAFMQHVIDTQDWDLIERRANSTAVQAYVKKNNRLPTGVNLNHVQTLGLRRGKGT